MIVNRDRFPDVDFLPEAEIRKIGTVGKTTLVLVGREQGTDAPIVSRSYTADPTTEELFAFPLYTLLNGQDPIDIPEPF